MKFFALITVLFWAAIANAACDYYASPAGGGDGLTSGTPFQIADFWAHASAGKRLCLNDGTYTGANSMVVPTATLSGSSGNPISVVAVNDGAVLIDGEYARQPIALNHNDYFDIEGINAAHAGDGSDTAHTLVVNVVSSNYVTFKRVIAWDSWDSGVQTPGTPNTSNNSVWTVDSSSNGLYEDVAALGDGRYDFLIISYTGAAENNTFRRAFCQFTKQISTFSNPRGCFNPVYSSSNNLLENVIAKWNPVCDPSGSRWGIVDGVGSAQDAGGGHSPGTRLYGSLAYTTVTAAVQPDSDKGLIASTGGYDLHLKDDVAFVPAGVTAPAARLYSPSQYALSAPYNLDATNLTLVGGTSNYIHSDWTQTNVQSYDNLTAVNAANANPFQVSAGTGARICYQYVDGILTSTPLWPWPMNDRIKNASTASGYALIDVTADVESMFGAIPAECRSDWVVHFHGTITFSGNISIGAP